MAKKQAEEQIEIDLKVPEEAPKGEIEVEVAKTEEAGSQAAAPEMPPEIGIRELKFQLEQEKLARAEADKRAREAAQREFEAKNEVSNTNLTLINNAIVNVRQETDYLKANYRDAMSVGDYDRAAEIQQRMADNSAKLLQLENGKTAMESQVKEAVPQYQQPLDPVETLASQLSPRSAAWIRQHPQFATDQRLFQKMIAAHNLAMADGLAPDSDDYFDVIEDTLKVNRSAPVAVEVADPTYEAAKVVQRRTSPPAAPVSRTATPGTRPNVVRLTADEREMARSLKMTDQEYAENKRALQLEGKL